MIAQSEELQMTNMVGTSQKKKAIITANSTSFVENSLPECAHKIIIVVTIIVAFLFSSPFCQNLLDCLLFLQ